MDFDTPSRITCSSWEGGGWWGWHLGWSGLAECLETKGWELLFSQWCLRGMGLLSWTGFHRRAKPFSTRKQHTHHRHLVFHRMVWPEVKIPVSVSVVHCFNLDCLWTSCKLPVYFISVIPLPVQMRTHSNPGLSAILVYDMCILVSPLCTTDDGHHNIMVIEMFGNNSCCFYG